ncbi:MAG: helix-turn-helix domain-containing protein [Bacteroidota bacterium]
MPIFAHIIIVLLLICLGLGVFLFTFLMGLDLRDQLKKQLLAFILLDCVVVVCVNSLYLSGYYQELPQFLRIEEPFYFIFGPLIYLIIRQERGLQKQRFQWLHFVPVGMIILSLLPFWLQSSADRIGWMDNFLSAEIRISKILWLGLRNGHLFIYLLFILRMNTRLQAWQQSTVYLFGVSMLALSLTQILFMLGGIPLGLVQALSALILAVLIYGIGYLSMRQIRKNIILLTDAPKAVRKSLEEDFVSTHLSKLDVLMHKDKIYQDEHLSLSSLAQQLNISSHQLSQLLNDNLNLSFADFLNQYRIDAVKQKLLDTQFRHLTILGIAMDSGFRSKSAFQEQFKKHTGLSPSVWRKQHTSKQA